MRYLKCDIQFAVVHPKLPRPEAVQQNLIAQSQVQQLLTIEILQERLRNFFLTLHKLSTCAY